MGLSWRWQDLNLRPWDYAYPTHCKILKNNYILNNIKTLEKNNMFALGFIRGTILGVSLGLMASLIAKKICKKDNNASDSKVDKKVN